MPWRHIGEWRYSSTHSFASALDRGEWSASRPGRFTIKERAPGTYWIGDWVDPRAGLEAVVKRKIPNPCRDSNPRSYSLCPSAIPLSYHGSNHRQILFQNIVKITHKKFDKRIYILYEVHTTNKKETFAHIMSHF
jgi:hypothetical protein